MFLDLGLETGLVLVEAAIQKACCGAENVLDYQKTSIEQSTGAAVTGQYDLYEGGCNFPGCDICSYHEDFDFCDIDVFNETVSICQPSCPVGDLEAEIFCLSMWKK